MEDAVKELFARLKHCSTRVWSAILRVPLTRPTHSFLLILPITPYSLLFSCALLLSGCAMPGDAAPVIKVGLIAPFEGLGRPLGYTLLPEIKAAISAANAAGRFGRYRVALVALNDDLDPATAAAQALTLAQDDDVVAVLGPWTAATVAAAAPILWEAGIPVLLAAPVTGALPGVRSLCPAATEVAAALTDQAAALGGGGWVETGGDPPSASLVTVAYGGDAAAGASDLLRWRAAGWTGTLVGGPDLFRPWLIDRAAEAAEDTLAAGCTPPRGLPESLASSPPTIRLAQAGARLLLDALVASGDAHGHPTRQGIAEILSAAEIQTGLTWFRVDDGQWVQFQ